MGYSKDGSITNFWPDDDKDTMYLHDCSGLPLSHLIEKAQEKWPGIDLDNIDISAEKIHTRCIYYDLYDGGDYDNFIVLRNKK